MTTFEDTRRGIVRDAIGIGLGTGAYALSFGALAVASGLSVLQTQALSVLMFTGASQFAMIGVLATGGVAVVAIATAALIGTRNSFYAIHMAPILAMRGWRRLPAAQLTIDESTGMALAHEQNGSGGPSAPGDQRPARLAFWATGLSIFVLWNLGTLIGAVGAGLLDDPAIYGLDAAAPAAFLALLWPRLGTWPMRLVAGSALVAAVAMTPLLRPGIPVLVAGAVGVAVGLVSGAGRAPRDEDTEALP